MNFKIGDRVKCIRESYNLELNKSYIVLDINDTNEKDIRIHVDPPDSRGEGWYQDRFELDYTWKFSNKLEEILND